MGEGRGGQCACVGGHLVYAGEEGADLGAEHLEGGAVEGRVGGVGADALPEVAVLRQGLGVQLVVLPQLRPLRRPAHAHTHTQTRAHTNTRAHTRMSVLSRSCFYSCAPVPCAPSYPLQHIRKIHGHAQTRRHKKTAGRDAPLRGPARIAVGAISHRLCSGGFACCRALEHLAYFCCCCCCCCQAAHAAAASCGCCCCCC